jgi:ribosomal protein S12 methylthiotransferase
MKKIHITTLGCSKNTVDSEVLMGQLQTHHFRLVENPHQSDVIIINTCGFIEDAKEESIQAIFEALRLKKEDPAKKVFVAGCLSQRYRKEIEKEIPEVDAIFGTEDYHQILQTLGVKHTAIDNLIRYRKLTTPRHLAYLKISEGCNHTCSFCAIPGIRGKHRSRSMESLVAEAGLLAENGAKELIIVSQDTSYYGIDLYGQQRIIELIEELSRIEKLEWIRVLYWYPTNFPREFIRMAEAGSKVIPYLDMPLQHISDRMLSLMRRGENSAKIKNILTDFRAVNPAMVFRTTFILGHPGETEDDFKELCDFVSEFKIDRIGTFVYSDEDGTHAAGLESKVAKPMAEVRREQLMEIQREISSELNEKLTGTIQKVLIDEYDREGGVYIGRTFRDAPEVDNEVLVTSERKLEAGDFLSVVVTGSGEYHLEGTPL